MAGIFRQLSYGGNSTINNNETPGKKRVSIGAFCTSPGTLQDVTMDNSYGVGYRSPCLSLNPYQGSTSPSSQQGRTVREFEEQMAALRKENFNLKLRLYFIEESIPNYQHATSNGDGPENLMKQLIDTKVEIEMLRKELQEKQELLKEAAQAMTQMEKIQLDTESKGESQIEELKQRIQYLEMEKDIERTEAGGELMDSLLGYSNLNDNLMTVQKVRELEGLVKQSEERIHQYQNQISKMDNLMEKRDKTIKELEDKVKEQAFQNSELLEQLELQERASCTAENESRKLRRENEELNRNLNVKDDFHKTNFFYNKDIYDNDVELADVPNNNFCTISNKNLLERFKCYEQLVESIQDKIKIAKDENRILASYADYLAETPRVMDDDRQNPLKNCETKYCYPIENEVIKHIPRAKKNATEKAEDTQRKHARYFNYETMKYTAHNTPNSICSDDNNCQTFSEIESKEEKMQNYSQAQVDLNNSPMHNSSEHSNQNLFSGKQHNQNLYKNNINNYRHIVEYFEPLIPVRYTLSGESYPYNRTSIYVPIFKNTSEASAVKEPTSIISSLINNGQEDASKWQMAAKWYSLKWYVFFGKDIYKNALNVVIYCSLALHFYMKITH